MIWLLCCVFLILALATLIGMLLARRTGTESSRAIIKNLNARIRSWWWMCGVILLAVLAGDFGSIILFGLVSFLALREFVTLTPTRRADHAVLCWCFFVFLPVQYMLVAIGWYGLFSIFVPVYVFLVLPVRTALSGDTGDFTGRVAKIQWGMMAAVYCISYVPALLMLEIPGYADNVRMLLWLLVTVQMSDVLQYVFGKLFGRRRIVPEVSPGKTVEGFVGGILSASLLGGLLYRLTPFTPMMALGAGMLVTLAGFGGGLCMSAVKRDMGVKDFGSMIAGHGGVLDRVDSLCFSAPLFFHMLRYFYT